MDARTAVICFVLPLAILMGTAKSEGVVGAANLGTAKTEGGTAAAGLGTAKTEGGTAAANLGTAKSAGGTAAAGLGTAKSAGGTAAAGLGTAKSAGGAEGEVLAYYLGWTYYKVPVSGTMTSANVVATCTAAGYVAPCTAGSECQYYSSECVDTGLEQCGNPMLEVSQEACGEYAYPSECPPFYGVFQYMFNWNDDSACGAFGGSWCALGINYSDQYAFCATGGEVLASYLGWTYYKVPVSGTMTSANVVATCTAAGYVAPCPAGSECGFSSSECVDTGLEQCDNPMFEVSQEACGDGVYPDDCPPLNGVFQYVFNWYDDSACGAFGGSWCVIGNDYSDQYAFCATGGAPSCPSGFDDQYGFGKCLYLHEKPRTYWDAKSICLSMGGDLFLLNNAEDTTKLKGLMTERRDADGRERGMWVGLTDSSTEGTFLWEDGSPLGEFTDWAPGSPADNTHGKDCVQMRVKYGWQWDVSQCTQRNAFICVAA